MPNGKPGDHPITDLIVHGIHSFPGNQRDIETLILAIHRLEPLDFRKPIWAEMGNKVWAGQSGKQDPVELRRWLREQLAQLEQKR